MTGEFGIAVHALVILNARRETISSEVLAKHVCTNPARVRRVMSKLKKRGLIKAKEGVDGGYRFLRAAKDITLVEVCDAVDGCPVSLPWRLEEMDRDCLAASGMSVVMEDIFRELNRLCRERLAEFTLADVHKRIFAEMEQSGSARDLTKRK